MGLVKDLENNLSLIKLLALLDKLNFVPVFEKVDLSIVIKYIKSILEGGPKDSLNLSTEIQYFIIGCTLIFNFNLHTSDVEVLLFIKKCHCFLTDAKDYSASSSVKDFKGYNQLLDNVLITNKSSKWIYEDNSESPANHSQFFFDNNSKSLRDDNQHGTKYVDKEEEKVTRQSKLKKKVRRAPAKSPYFSSSKLSKKCCEVKALNLPTKLPRRILSTSLHFKTPNVVLTVSRKSSRKHSSSGATSCIPFPPISESYFGLIQEKLADDPFRLLIAITFLIRTHGKYALPIYHALINKYSTPESFVAANVQDIVSMITCLGFQNQRANTFKSYASIWLKDPPARDKRYAVRDYPNHGSGRDIKKGEILTDSDKRDAWEIGHMTSGPYALDSWRIFCRDKLRNVAIGWNGEGAEDGFQPEWMRVLPQDKELRAFLQWMWLKEGFIWDPETGEKEVATTELMIAAQTGRIVRDDYNGLRIITKECTVGEVAEK